MKRLLLAVLLSPMAWALEVPSVPDAQRVFEETRAVRDYLMATGPVQQTGRELRLDDFVEVTGQLNRVTLELPRRLNLEEAYDLLRPQGEVLFECEGRACGRSNLWANSLYNRAQLYGRDRDQRYIIVQSDNQTLAFYLIERGNRRVYAHFEHLVAEVSVVRAGQPVLLDATFNDNDRLIGTPDFSRMLQAAADHPNWRWRVVLELPGTADLDELQRRANRRGAQLSEQLASVGLNWPIVILAGAGASIDAGDRVSWIGFTP